MAYRLVSAHVGMKNSNYCNILWFVLACITVYVVYCGYLKKQNVQVGVMKDDSYEHFYQKMSEKNARQKLIN
jgi:hypothetical protein